MNHRAISLQLAVLVNEWQEERVAAWRGECFREAFGWVGPLFQHQP